ncbi:MAG: hypothetical protein OEM97_09605, partial [Acidimicrobiia bacterium]|nr:hypothetical protein [Acidimicrobiia bacterium]
GEELWHEPPTDVSGGSGDRDLHSIGLRICAQLRTSIIRPAVGTAFTTTPAIRAATSPLLATCNRPVRWRLAVIESL